MSNYSKTTDFAAKDALSTGNANKIVKGTEIDDEFSAIQTAVNSKADTNSPALTGTPTAPTASSATDNTQLATTAYVTAAITTAVAATKTALLPVGSIYTQASVATNPATLLGFGTWAAFGAGRVMVGLDGGNTLFDTVEETGGSADAVIVSHTHTATVTDPGHTHALTTNNQISTYGGTEHEADFNGSERTNSASIDTAPTGITVANSTEGVSGTDANYQPYITVYMWKRTA
jgi:hypothetical protein